MLVQGLTTYLLETGYDMISRLCALTCRSLFPLQLFGTLPSEVTECISGQVRSPGFAYHYASCATNQMFAIGFQTTQEQNGSLGSCGRGGWP